MLRTNYNNNGKNLSSPSGSFLLVLWRNRFHSQLEKSHYDKRLRYKYNAEPIQCVYASASIFSIVKRFVWHSIRLFPYWTGMKRVCLSLMFFLLSNETNQKNLVRIEWIRYSIIIIPCIDCSKYLNENDDDEKLSSRAQLVNFHEIHRSKRNGKWDEKQNETKSNSNRIVAGQCVLSESFTHNKI